MWFPRDLPPAFGNSGRTGKVNFLSLPTPVVKVFSTSHFLLFDKTFRML